MAATDIRIITHTPLRAGNRSNLVYGNKANTSDDMKLISLSVKSERLRISSRRYFVENTLRGHTSLVDME